jgi:hypothetical protein
MEQGSVEYVRVVRTIDHGIDAVWQQIADFGGIARWIVGVSDCSVSGEGVGCIRTVSIGGRQVDERLHTSDRALGVLAYQILPPHSLPASDILSTIELSSAGTGRTRIVWRSQAVPNIDPAILRASVEPFFEASLDNLQRLLDQAA